jgi:outer membrane biosynthesis protein TonB
VDLPGFVPAPPEGTAREFNPVLLTQLQDELARSRLREAFWISLVAHLLAAILLALSPKWMPVFRPLQLRTAEQMIRDKELTYLEMPPDSQRPLVKAPDTKFLSDKNRIARARVPTPDRKVLDSLRLPGPPGPPAQAAPAPISPGTAAGQQQASNSSQLIEPTPSKRAPEPKPDLNALARTLSPGSSIAQAARDSARTGFSTGGAGGNYGHPLGGGSKVGSGIDVLSDTMGVDFGPYLSRVLAVVRMNWYSLIPEEARPPLLKRGKVAIEFAILPDGKVAGMRLTGQSGDIALDRAAWGGISASNPFSPLPSEFHGPYLALRFYFYYNPDRRDFLD